MENMNRTDAFGFEDRLFYAWTWCSPFGVWGSYLDDSACDGRDLSLEVR